MTVDLAPYPSYTEVGVRWHTRLPAAWQLIRLRYLCEINTGSGDTQDAVADGPYLFFVRSPTPLRSPVYTFDGEAILTAGDGAVGEVFHHYVGRFHAHQRVYVLTGFRSSINPRFLFYAFSTHFRLMASDGSARTTVDSVRRWMLTDMPVAVPPLTEQLRIVEFLDRETAQIDALLAAQERFVELLRERRAAVLDAHFQARVGKRDTTVRRVLRKLDRPVSPGLGVVTAYRDGQVTLRSNRRDEGYTFSVGEAGYQGVAPGDIVFHALDGFAGAIGVSDSHGVCSPVYHVCETCGDAAPEYVALLLRYLGAAGFLAAQAPSVRQRSVDFRNWETFARVPLAMPNLDAQKAFVAEFTARAKLVDALIAKTEEHIVLAKERRAALITAAVTGQIDVTGKEA